MKPLDKYEIVFSLASAAEILSSLPPDATFEDDGEKKRIEVNSPETYSQLLTSFVNAGAVIHHSEARRTSLEDFFVNLVRPNREQGE